MHKVLFCLALLAAAAIPAAYAQNTLEPRLVKELRTTPVQSNTSAAPPFLASLGQTIFYINDTPGSGLELWKTDGTDAGTMMLQDFYPGPLNGFNSYNGVVGILNGRLYFSADCGSNTRARLWKTDGTLAGTIRIKDLQVAPNDFNYASAIQNGALYFFAYDGQHGTELWKTDGTDAGTVMVRDLVAGAAGLNGETSQENLQIVAYKTILLFCGSDGTGGMKLWKSDGTAAGTKLVKDVSLGSKSTLSFRAQTRDQVFFSVWDPDTYIAQYWVTDGTAAGTVMLFSQTISSTKPDAPGPFTAFGNKVFFPWGSPATGAELWVSDGTPAGTTPFKDLVPGTASSWPRELTVFNGAIYFIAFDPEHGQELWKSDGTAAGTALLKDINPGTVNGVYDTTRFYEAGGRLYFVAIGSDGHPELWQTDGTAAGTIGAPVANSQASLRILGAAGNRIVYYASKTYGALTEMWLSDGTVAGTRQITHSIGSVSEPSIQAMGTAGNRLIVSANNRDSGGFQLWSSDGTTSGTGLLQETAPSSKYGFKNMVNIGGKLYYFDDYNLWQTDGTDAGTVKIQAPGGTVFGATDVSQPVPLQGNAWFIKYRNVTAREFWKTNGTMAGTKRVFTTPQTSYLMPPPVTSGNRLYYIAGYYINYTLGDELWMTDGVSTPTLVKDVNPGNTATPGYTPANANQLTDVNGTLFFVADDGVHGIELWKSQGTPASTVLVRDINPGTSGTLIANLTGIHGKLFFTATTPDSGSELWVSDGTAAGTRMVKDIAPGAAGANPAKLFNVNGALYFTADSPGTGRELWRSDGTPEGTVLVKDINSGPEGSAPDNFANAGGFLYFSTYSPSRGVEMWRSDGTGAGTVRISDITPGPASSNPARLTVAGRYLFFTAIDGRTSQGNELWAIDIGPVTGVRDWRLYGE